MRVVGNRRGILLAEKSDSASAEALREEFLTILRNIPDRISSKADVLLLRKALKDLYQRYDNLANAVFTPSLRDKFSSVSSLWWNFQSSLNSMVYAMEWRGRAAENLASKIADLNARHPDTDWEDYFRGRPLASQEELDAVEVESIKKRVLPAKRKSMALARKLWVELEWFERAAQIQLSDHAVNFEEVKIGNVVYQIAQSRATEEDRWTREFFRNLREFSEFYEERAMKVAPWLIKHQLPVEINVLDNQEDAAGRYLGTKIVLGRWGVFGFYNNRRKFTHTMAHEMAHHLYHALSRSAESFWEDAFSGDHGEFDVDEIVGRMLPDETPVQFSRRIEKEDPVTAMRAEMFYHIPTLSRLDITGISSLVTAWQNGKISGKYHLPKNPITAYASKNATEAFCEALSMLVAYGPRAIPPVMKAALEVILRRSDGYRFSESTAASFLSLFHR